MLPATRAWLRREPEPRPPRAALPVPFDPLWPHFDKRDRYRAAPFHRFEGFFRRFGWRFRRRPSIRSYRDFFPGAFTYHWHNCWGASEHVNSYFGLFNQQFSGILRDRLQIGCAAP